MRKERFELPDGDFVDGVWALPEPADPKAPVVMVLHGLEGSIESPYARGILRALAARGWRAVLMHWRGCSGVPNRLERAYHSGDTGDYETVLSRLMERFPDAPFATIGYSLGANVLLKWLGEAANPAERPLKAAVAVSPPFDLAACTDHLNVGVSRIYQKVFIDSLKAARARKQHIPTWMAKIRTIREWDEKVTAPIHGFAGADDYYSRSSCVGYMNRVCIPTLVVHASDDPFLPTSAIPSRSHVSTWVDLQILDKGGHVGFVTGRSPRRPRYWLEEHIPEYLATRLG